LEWGTSATGGQDSVNEGGCRAKVVEGLEKAIEISRREERSKVAF
jgi:hypothetical protein